MINTLKSILVAALLELYEKDYKLIKNEANEVTLNGRLAKYLRPDLECGTLKVDIEYNKHISEKKIYGHEGKYGIVDIVVHERMTDKNNLIAIECKRRGISENDINKIRALVSPDFDYKLGVTISYYSREVSFYTWDEENTSINVEAIRI